MNIVKLNTCEISSVSGGGVFFTLTLANLFSVLGYVGAHTYSFWQYYKNSERKDHPDMTNGQIANNVMKLVLSKNGLVTMAQPVYYFAESCLFGNIVGHVIAYPLWLVGLVKFPKDKDHE
jgi:hypothetical protein